MKDLLGDKKLLPYFAGLLAILFLMTVVVGVMLSPDGTPFGRAIGQPLAVSPMNIAVPILKEFGTLFLAVLGVLAVIIIGKIFSVIRKEPMETV